jgi:hypothetical protein
MSLVMVMVCCFVSNTWSAVDVVDGMVDWRLLVEAFVKLRWRIHL